MNSTNYQRGIVLTRKPEDPKLLKIKELYRKVVFTPAHIQEIDEYKQFVIKLLENPRNENLLDEFNDLCDKYGHRQ